MFCMQCEQTAGGRGCLSAGRCGKSAETSRLQDGLTGALIAAARNGEGLEPQLLAESLFATLTNVNFDDAALARLAARVGQPPYDLGRVHGAPEDARGLRTLLLAGLRGVAAYAFHSMALGADIREIARFMENGLAAVGDEDLGLDGLLSLALECGEANLSALRLLDRANTEAFGVPGPVKVSRVIGPGPFVVASGHDFLDLRLLLEQAGGRGVDVYTHGELLPAHAYPGLGKYPALKGNFGTAWQNQQREFAGVPGAFLFTTNCLMPPTAGHADRVFTTGPVGHPGIVHIGDDKDFSPVIGRALELGGYGEARGKGHFTTGFGHQAVLSLADTVVGAVRSGAIRHFFLVGGCDGERASRDYYAEFVRRTPKDTLVLTLGCGKFRFNDLDLGTAGGLPRLLDMGQCNDAFGAIRVALALAEALGCGVNDLPLSLVLSWYEQKAVAILLTLLHLGIRNILLGPTLPAFVTPKVLDRLVAGFGLAPLGEPGADLARLLGQPA
ncbi:MAG: hydroxylamine reductase [Deltaproteobacteria bacterium]|jgi:hydroxylamine reductase|nr:hydroxylamine reductase [Deltaproteobacteria bacterium]